MKIVYCIRGLYNAGGMERVLANKANYLAKQGYDITIVTTDQQGQTPYFELDSRIATYDLSINYYQHVERGLLIKIGSYAIKQRMHQRRLTKLLKALQADIVISMFDAEVSFLHKVNDGSKKVLEIHFSRFKKLQYGRKGALGAVDRWRNTNDLKLAQQYARFVVLTEEDRGYWGNLPNMSVIPNANSFVPSGQASLVNKRAIAVGRYDYQKGFDELIAIWAEVHEFHPDWSLDIFGHGPLKDQLQNQIDALGLGQVVHLRPPVKHIEQEYLNSSMLVMTSRYEGLPMVLLEAQACGLPLVAYACKCGPRDIIRNGKNGFLVEERNSAVMVEKLVVLMDEEELRKEMGRQALLLLAHFSEDRVMKQWLDLLNGLIQKNT